MGLLGIVSRLSLIQFVQNSRAVSSTDLVHGCNLVVELGQIGIVARSQLGQVAQLCFFLGTQFFRGPLLFKSSTTSKAVFGLAIEVTGNNHGLFKILGFVLVAGVLLGIDIGQGMYGQQRIVGVIGCIGVVIDVARFHRGVQFIVIGQASCAFMHFFNLGTLFRSRSRVLFDGINSGRTSIDSSTGYSFADGSSSPGPGRHNRSYIGPGAHGKAREHAFNGLAGNTFP